eukprot:UN24809
MHYKDFVFDDTMIPESKDIIGERAISESIYYDYWGDSMATKWASKSWRPLTVATFRYNWYQVADSPPLYHQHNILFHGIVCFIVPCLLQLHFSNFHLSFIAGLLFATHPVHSEAVANLVGRAEMLTTMFGCLYLIFNTLFYRYQNNTLKKSICLILSNISLCFSILSKEQGLMFLFFHGVGIISTISIQ